MRDWHRLEHTGTEPGLQPFHGPNHLHRFAYNIRYGFHIHTVLDGELAVPCYPQSAIAGLNAYLRFEHVRSALQK